MSNVKGLDAIVERLKSKHGTRVSADYLKDYTLQTFADGVTCRIDDDGTVTEGVRPLAQPKRMENAKVTLLCASCRIINKDNLGAPIGVLGQGQATIEGATFVLCDQCLDAAERMGYEVERMKKEKT